ncbi:Hsp70 family protein [Roseovarius sp. EL26]|uniref:Hsp70 family protein n=1 Tax=Roseovarius sp. EL26 TaxID=2126672 RepID=UPI000EA375A7|nr:Hsp70 family protein [Roseovarius sp. EL26]
MAQPRHTLGIDFGTSNSAAGFLHAGLPQLIEMEPGQKTLPTTFFFDFDTRRTLIGSPANRALLDGEDGRFMRALKRVLGTPLMHEQRQILNQQVTFVDIIARFLRQIKTRAEAETGLRFDSVLSGCPVVFHGINDPREAQAENDLRACYHAAGFTDVDFMAEPEAAAIASGALEHSNEIGLIVDIGGGTSDFSLFRSGQGGVEILANHGVRIGGTDFDRSISINQVMPLLGKDTQLRKAMGPGTSPVPNAIFNDLATWEKIPFLYNRQNRRMVSEMLKLSEEPTKLSRLDAVLEHELGHDLAFAVERGKIAANTGAQNPMITLNQVERDLSTPLPADLLAACLSKHKQALHLSALETLKIADTDVGKVSRVIYVGGSSLMSMVTDTMKEIFPEAEHSFSEVFTAVANGLAIAAARH